MEKKNKEHSSVPSRLEQNQITEVPARAFLPYPRLRRMLVSRLHHPYPHRRHHAHRHSRHHNGAIIITVVIIIVLIAIYTIVPHLAVEMISSSSSFTSRRHQNVMKSNLGHGGWESSKTGR